MIIINYNKFPVKPAIILLPHKLVIHLMAASGMLWRE